MATTAKKPGATTNKKVALAIAQANYETLFGEKMA